MTTALREVARRRGVKLLLVRRPAARDLAPDGPRRVFLVDVRRGRSSVLTRTVPRAELPTATAGEEGWQPRPEPLLLVCTHGRKDWCCALRGRPLVTALAALDGGPVWECSHLGGDRFAATALALPSGVTHGRLAPADASALLASLAGGRVLVDRFRGRSCDPGVVQAAEGHARLVRGIEDVEALRPRAVVEGVAGRWRVDMEHAGGLLRVHLRVGSAPAQRLTCSATEDRHARTWELDRLEG